MYETKRLEIETYHWRQEIPAYEIINSGYEEREWRSISHESMVRELKTRVLKDSYEEIPASWWQHFKRDCLPAWFVKRWPVKYVTVTLVLCFKPDLRTHELPYVQIDTYRPEIQFHPSRG